MRACTHRWAAVHHHDAARLLCDAVEPPQPGTRDHAVAESNIPYRDTAETIGPGLGVTTQRAPSDETQAHFGWLGMFAAIDNPTSSELTRETTRCAPREAGYFDMP